LRLRNIPGALDILKKYSNIVIPDPKNHKGKWSELFCNSNPIHIEIGMGKGQFLIGMAKMFPHINFIGMERYESVMVRGLDKLLEDPLPNIRLLQEDAGFLLDFFAEGELGRVYLNFSDPWPKLRHAKRRLTHHNFLNIYKTILEKGGNIWFKSDNRGLVEFSLESFNSYPLKISELSLNLHDAEPEFNVRTEYENSWSERGYPIYRAVLDY
jgi:tRNA (guanine-N7-)-methyltransferase